MSSSCHTTEKAHPEDFGAGRRRQGNAGNIGKLVTSFSIIARARVRIRVRVRTVGVNTYICVMCVFYCYRCYCLQKKKLSQLTDELTVSSKDVTELNFSLFSSCDGAVIAVFASEKSVPMMLPAPGVAVIGFPPPRWMTVVSTVGL